MKLSGISTHKSFDALSNNNIFLSHTKQFEKEGGEREVMESRGDDNYFSLSAVSLILSLSRTHMVK